MNKAYEESVLAERRTGAEDMRERAAREVEEFRPTITGTDEVAIRQQFRWQAAAAIRALPLDAETPALEDDHG